MMIPVEAVQRAVWLGNTFMDLSAVSMESPDEVSLELENIRLALLLRRERTDVARARVFQQITVLHPYVPEEKPLGLADHRGHRAHCCWFNNPFLH